MPSALIILIHLNFVCLEQLVFLYLLDLLNVVVEQIHLVTIVSLNTSQFLKDDSFSLNTNFLFDNLDLEFSLSFSIHLDRVKALVNVE